MLSHIGIDAANLQPSAFDKKVKICSVEKNVVKCLLLKIYTGSHHSVLKNEKENLCNY